MTYNKIFVDSDVLLDLLLQREPFYLHSQRLFDTGKEKDLKLYTSTLILANVHYLVAKLTNKNDRKRLDQNFVEIIGHVTF